MTLESFLVLRWCVVLGYHSSSHLSIRLFDSVGKTWEGQVLSVFHFIGDIGAY